MLNQKIKMVAFGIVIYLSSSIVITWAIIAFGVHFLDKGDTPKCGSANVAMFICWAFSLIPILIGLVFVIPFFSRFPETFNFKKVFLIGTISGTLFSILLQLLITATTEAHLIVAISIGFAVGIMGAIAIKYVWNLNSGVSVDK